MLNTDIWEGGRLCSVGFWRGWKSIWGLGKEEEKFFDLLYQPPVTLSSLCLHGPFPIPQLHPGAEHTKEKGFRVSSSTPRAVVKAVWSLFPSNPGTAHHGVCWDCSDSCPMSFPLL